ncbi:hypothetical protein [Amycolatopsis sp. 195334CR]|uniref:hypothetical protein n=1 Tax=Amycolatopsis sp. 195334CR TaxID=2814588 RepID=UPI001A8D63AF|nr:hypothetical protein [Amycolatopsis sp. 195334CR]MBN6038468.1 hypothetical protein [Amycolatopsis sp. 195334CR]
MLDAVGGRWLTALGCDLGPRVWTARITQDQQRVVTCANVHFTRDGKARFA